MTDEPLQPEQPSAPAKPKRKRRKKTGQKRTGWCRKGLHRLTPENGILKVQGKYHWLECRECSNARARERRAEVSPKKAARAAREAKIAELQRQHAAQAAWNAANKVVIGPVLANGNSLLNSVPLTPDEMAFLKDGKPMPKADAPDPIEQQLVEAFPKSTATGPAPVSSEVEAEPVAEAPKPVPAPDPNRCLHGFTNRIVCPTCRSMGL